jgi:L-fucose mutarotase/ribose pyranase (RbsD/FucU family)
MALYWQQLMLREKTKMDARMHISDSDREVLRAVGIDATGIAEAVFTTEQLASQVQQSLQRMTAAEKAEVRRYVERLLGNSSSAA